MNSLIRYYTIYLTSERLYITFQQLRMICHRIMKPSDPIQESILGAEITNRPSLGCCNVNVMRSTFIVARAEIACWRWTCFKPKVNVQKEFSR
ncbi:hypothetical protein Hdeb2414_s0009g00321441 [Helianthus debilis subsp. tardiflorus]